MRVEDHDVEKVFVDGRLYVLPQFQRQYVWGQDNWSTLFGDVLDVYRAYEAGSQPEHFLGSLVFVRDTNEMAPGIGRPGTGRAGRTA